MPHATRTASATRQPNSKTAMDSSMHLRTSMEPFPDHIDSSTAQNLYPSSPIRHNSQNGLSPQDRWQSRRDSSAKGQSWNEPVSTGGRGHGRQKSLGDAIRIIRGRNGSISQNAHELGDALKAPVSPKLVVSNPQDGVASPRLSVDIRSCASYGTCQALSRIRLRNRF
jgi:solute carrier family 35 protein E1